VVRDTHNVIPVTMALLLHVLVFTSLFVVLDFGDRARPAMPLAISATLVAENAVVIPPKVEEVAEVEEVEEVVVPPEPDTSEQDRLKAEEKKRQDDARIERERLNRIKQQEEERKQAEAEAEKQRIADAEKRRKAEEAEKERKRVEAERAREAEIERQRQENERLRAEAAAQRQAELDAESRRLDAIQANAESAYIFAIQQKIARNWVRPPTASAGLECIVNVRQLPGGEVVNVSLGSCNGDETVRRSIEAAVFKASPLPAPADPSVFDRNLRLEFRPTD
jgi:colicin import membrane protein